MHSFQHSHECKCPTSLGVDLQPQLAVQANCVSKGNKNGIRSFMGNSTHTKNLCGKYSTSTLSHVKDQNSLSGKMKPDKYVSWSENNHALSLSDAYADNKENKILLADSDTISQPPLVGQNVLF